MDDAAIGGLSLHIHHDDGAVVYVNGAKVAAFDRDVDVYAHVPIDTVLKEGANTVAIHCHQVSGPQYIDAGLVSVGPGEKLYNGIELPAVWPPSYDRNPREPMPVPYLERPPAVIPIDVGRQLFVDDFLIEKTTLEREFHRPEYHEANPVLKPDRPWEMKSVGWFAAPLTMRNCKGISADRTLVRLTWRRGDLSKLAGEPVRFRFHLTDGSLYAFWVSPDRSGASHGYVGAGGPGFTGATDRAGMGAYKYRLDARGLIDYACIEGGEGAGESPATPLRASGGPRAEPKRRMKAWRQINLRPARPETPGPCLAAVQPAAPRLGPGGGRRKGWARSGSP